MTKYQHDTKSAIDLNDRKSSDRVLNIIEILFILLSLTILMLSLFFSIASVSGSSMEKTLSNGDYIIFSGLFYTPKSGDIVVFDANSSEFDYPLVKRVIATEGQTIDIDPATGLITVDSIPLSEPYIKDQAAVSYGTDIFPYTVEPGRVFLLGDNRNNSVDSRSDIIGTVPVENILGKVILRFYPFTSFGIPN
ncbi:MAG: signal peptidase I [Clostridia bacterium]|nr:signal peptidase I [Clostridia bacterium]